MEELENVNTDPAELTENAAREELILQPLRQIRHIAQGISAKLPLHVDFSELLGAGALGLRDAIQNFGASRDVRFRTYAELRIRGAMLDSLRDLDWAPRSLRKKCRRLERVAKELENRLGRPPSQSEISSAMSLSLTEYYALVCQIQGLNVLGQEEFAVHDREKSSQNRTEYVKDTGGEDPFFALQRAETRDLVGSAISALPKKERLVISLYYFDELPMKEIGRILGLTVSSVSFLHTKALTRLRSRLRKTTGCRNN